MPTLSERAREILAAEIEKLTPKGDGRAQILREFDWDNLSWFQQASLRAIESALSSPIGEGVREGVIEECAKCFVCGNEDRVSPRTGKCIGCDHDHDTDDLR